MGRARILAGRASKLPESNLLIQQTVDLVSASLDDHDGLDRMLWELHIHPQTDKPGKGIIEIGSYPVLIGNCFVLVWPLNSSMKAQQSSL